MVQLDENGSKTWNKSTTSFIIIIFKGDFLLCIIGKIS